MPRGWSPCPEEVLGMRSVPPLFVAFTAFVAGCQSAPPQSTCSLDQVPPALARPVATADSAIGILQQRLSRRVLEEMGRGVTVYRARGGKTGEDREILYCVVTRLEIGRVMRIIQTFDTSAFVVQHPLADVRGGVVHRHALP